MSQFVIPNRIYDPHAECMPREERRKLQAERLRITMARALAIPFYQKKFAESKVSIESIKSVDDIRRLPFTVKSDLREAYPFGFVAVPKRDLVRIHASTGTTGKPTFVGYTRSDLKIWSELCARFLVAGGLTEDQLVQVAFGYGLFTGGFGLHGGIERVGAAVLPASSGNTQRQITLLRDAGVDTLICTPSYALNIAEVALSMGIKRGDLALKYGHFGSEPWTEEMRGKIEEELGIRVFNNYGLSEVIGPGVSGECAVRNGMHLHEDHFIVECIDPDTCEPVPEGEVGELVITSLTKEACPIIRYRTRDLARVYHDPCPCGRTESRMSWTLGRSDDMLIIRGVNVFPTQIEEALLRVDGTAPHFMIELSRPGNTDVAVIRVEVRENLFSDKMDEMQKLRDRIAAEVTSITGLHFIIELVAPHTLERFTGKAKRVIDHRKLTNE